MLRAKDILRRNGEPITVNLTTVAHNQRGPSELWGFAIELPEKVKAEMRAAARKEAVEAGRRFGLDEEAIQAHVRETIDDAPIECLAAEPFELCWN